VAIKVRWGRVAFATVAALVVVLVVIGLRPSPLVVDIAAARRGPMRVTIDQEGEARAHDRYIVSAPVAGRTNRIELHEGDWVRRGSVVASINPVPLDARETAESRARLESAEALRREAVEKAERLRADYEQARRERERAEALVKDGLVSVQTLEQARSTEETSFRELAGARSRADAAASDVELARAALIAIAPQPRDSGRIVTLRSPVSGQVLNVVEKSERVVASGSPLIVIGDPAKMEIVADVLTTDAVKVKVGDTVLLEGWGGDYPIRARVRRIEAAAFMKISALGVEEQRVNVIADFVDPPGLLADGYRVEARIVVWEKDDVLTVPASAVFREGDGWSVFLVEGGFIRRRGVEIGHRTSQQVQVISGLSEGQSVVLHPSNQIKDGARVAAR
jgi:HlyD family secretion protein